MAEENGVEFSSTEKDEGKKEVQVDEGDDHASDGDENNQKKKSFWSWEKKEKEPSPPTVNYFKLYSFADTFDYLLMIVGTAGAATHGAALPVFFLFFGKLINSLGTADISQAKQFALYFLYLGLIVMGASWAEVACWMHTGERQSARIRSLYLRALMKQEIGFFDKSSSSGELVGRVSSDVLLVQDAISEKVGNFIHYLTTFFAGFIIGFTSIWQLALIILGVVPLIAACGGVYTALLTGYSSKGQEAYANAGGIAEQVFSQIRTVYSFVGETKGYQAYSKAMESTLTLGIKSGIAKGGGLGFLYGVLFCAWSLEFYYASTLIARTPPKANGGEALTTMFAVIIGGISLGQALPNLTAFAKGMASAYHIFDLISRKSEIDIDDLSGETPETIEGHIELKDVHFSYPSRPDVPIFQGFTLAIPAGKTVALVGASGSGKSTVVSLIERFYDPAEGQILIDGRNIKTLQLKWLRQQLGLVSQEPALFATSIRENILYGKGDASEDEIIAAAKAANAHSFITSLPEGYDTQVGERGTQMSGGQKQRIAIARAILKNPAILLLDEATSALDNESERIVQAALDNLMVGRTTVIIAHRLTTIRGAHSIAVVSQGRIVEQGPHAQLMAVGESGAYFQLARVQELARQKDAEMAQKSPRISLQQPSALSETSLGAAEEKNIENVHKEINTSEEDSPKQGNQWLRLFSLCSGDWPYILFASLGAAAAGSINPLFALFLSEVIRAYYFTDFDKLRDTVYKYCIIFACLGVVCVPIYILQHYCFGVVGEKLTKRVRELMFKTFTRNEVGWYDLDENNSGAVASRLATDATLVRAAIGDRISVLVQNLSMLAVAFTISIVLQWKMALVVIATFPLICASAMVEQASLKGFAGDLAKAHERSSTVASEAVSNIRTVASFSAEDKVLNLFTKNLLEPLKAAAIRGNIAGIVYGGSQLIMYGSFGLGLWYGSTLVPDEADFGDILKVFMVLIVTSFGIAECLTLAPDLAKGGQAVHSFFSVVDRATLIDPDDETAEKPEKIDGQIELKRVSFAYPLRPEVMVFEDFSLKVPQGKTVALVGASGSGKSSVVSLIERFYDPLEGQVLIDGKDIREYHLRSLRKFIGLVAQEPALFATSIRENILYGCEGATEAEIISAAKAANAHNFIASLPNGYDTEVGERGVQLSGGQKQRVAIARAVLKNPAILLLDEATSALDSESERVVQEALDRLMQNRTTIVIAHRLSTIRNADVIAVVQEGKVLEKGTHSELFAKEKGAYRALLNLQQNTGGAAL